jgi:exodeoxyribonuclease III
MKIISWNVNGLRAVHRKDALKSIWDLNPDIVCLQETKVHEDEAPFDLRYIPGYSSYFNSGVKKGYSGVGLYTKKEPLEVTYSFGDEIFDSEGRIIKAVFDEFILFNIYFPNGGASKERLKYKLDFYYSFFEKLKEIKDKNVIICGDVNTAHREIDLARPKENQKTSGFLIEEREWIDELLKLGFVDAFREINGEVQAYSWWDMKTRARERDVGWRIDYFFVSNSLKKSVEDCKILNEIFGSDHAPVSLVLKNVV